MFSLAIIAGGKSSRMGTDKSFVLIDGQPIIEHLIQRTKQLSPIETLLITNRFQEYEHLGLPMISDVVPDKGSLGGIYTAIYHTKAEYTLVLACDMPFINENLLRFMLTYIQGDEKPDVIVPRVDEYPQGLHAIYSKRCLESIRQRMDENKLKVIGFYPSVKVTYLDESDYLPYDPDGFAFFNVNTPEELEKARQHAQKLKDQ